jgi:hypothetical protein
MKVDEGLLLKMLFVLICGIRSKRISKRGKGHLKSMKIAKQGGTRI